MIRINPLDPTFLLLENATRRMHMTAFMIFRKPKGRQSSFGPRLVEAYRRSQAASPSDRRLKRLTKLPGDLIGMGNDVVKTVIDDALHRYLHEREANAATKRAKDKGRGTQKTARQAYALLLTGSLTVADVLPLFGKMPSANLVISIEQAFLRLQVAAGTTVTSNTRYARKAA
jgi:hypothetical protein